MMNHRALVRAHTHWRPRRGAPAPSAVENPVRRSAGPWRVWLAACLLALAACVGVFMLLRGSHPEGPALPATPTAWLDAFSAGVARDSGDVCTRLLSPTFRSAFEREVHQPCASYYAHAEVLSIRVLQILRSGDTAAVEVRYWPRGGYSTFVLDRQAKGWQAVAIVPGGPLPTA